MAAGTQAKNRRGAFWQWGLWLAMTGVLLLLAKGDALVAVALKPDAPDLFAREDIQVETGQKFGRLLVAGGNATVGGEVEKGIVVVDGDLILLSQARIKGAVLVLGGHVRLADEVSMEKPVLAVAPGKAPFAGRLVAGLLLAGTVGLVALPVAVWLLARRIRHTRFARWLEELFHLRQQRWPAFYLLLTLALCGLMLAAFAEVAWETLFRYEMTIFDNMGLWLVRYFANPALDEVMVAISALGYGYLFGAIILATLVRLAFSKDRFELAGMIAALGGATLLNMLLKNLFGRSRPDASWLVEASGYSFPSGHAMVSFCFYGMLAFLLARRLRRWRWRLAISALALFLAVAIGLSRIYLGVHYPTDVVAGYFAGATWLAFCIHLLQWYERQQRKGADR